MNKEQMEIKDISQIVLGENDVLLVTIDRGNMPGKVFEKHAEQIKENLGPIFKNNKIIVTSDDIKFTVIKESELVNE